MSSNNGIDLETLFCPITGRINLFNILPNETGLLAGRIDTNGEKIFAAAEEGVDYPSFEEPYILTSPSSAFPNAQALSDLVTVSRPNGGLLKSNMAGTLSIALPGLVPLIHDYVDPGSLDETVSAINTEVAATNAQVDALNAEIVATNAEVDAANAQIVALNAEVVETNAEIAAVQANLEAQILAVTGYTTLGLLTEFLVSIGWTAGYGEYLWDKYKPLLTKNKYSDTDNNDYQHGNIWFDANHIGAAGNFKPGIRVTSWDSSLVIDNDLFPVSIGLFGYKSSLGYVPQQSGFVWQSYFENNSSSDHYRYPKNFGLYYVTHNKGQIGWDGGERLLMEYKYYDKKFSFEEDAVFNKKLKAGGGLYLGTSSSSQSGEDLMFLEEASTSGKILKYNDGGSVKVPIADIVQGPGVIITRGVDTNNQPTDKVTISADSREVVGTDNQISVNTVGAVSTVSIAENATIPGDSYTIIPAGASDKRPINSIIGMLRVNTE